MGTYFKKLIFKTNDLTLHVLFFISLGLTLWASNIYKLTIIDTKYLLMTVGAGMTISLLLLRFSIKSNYPILWTVFLKAAIGGGLFYFGLLFINQKFTDKALLVHNFSIIEAGPSGRQGTFNAPKSYAIIDFYGKEKELIFYYDYSSTVKFSSKVNLAYSKGAFGFNVIKSQRLTN